MDGVNDRWPRFEHELFGFSVSYPPDWEAVPSGLGAALLLLAPISEPVPFRANLVVTLHPLPEGGLEGFVSDQKERSAVVLTDLEITGEETSSSRAGEGLWYSASYRQGRQMIQLMQWNVARGPQVLSVSAAAEAGDMAAARGTFEEIWKSLELRGPDG